ncbi:hypothetical protein QBC33DRAFT_525294 [Phialemonium atrogriseum]|uniref:Secreted protein n=1 Tax=Phialemonium atrogriseum TaxID=1093897 RepID=A0AAJ0CAZ9_9PEZI|nr:uncharacterized protein QBC33DRAFT_525294 [Phialemonium atrogriseum]KAK1771967.1 hypothetical protein QBC33DRAFT_525294 [Phialemonium atrogriseum]
MWVGVMDMRGSSSLPLFVLLFFPFIRCGVTSLGGGHGWGRLGRAEMEKWLGGRMERSKGCAGRTSAVATSLVGLGEYSPRNAAMGCFDRVW